MPPRKGPRNVVKSGNAGNSAKSAPPPQKQGPAADDPPRPKPLFPVGYKTPVTLLNERCQKEGWERPVVEATPNKGNGTWNVKVLLRKRKNKNVTDLDVVRMVAEVKVDQGEQEQVMARHMGAVYGLFRFCSHLPLSMVLPPSIRPYWSTLLAEKAAAPAHREWEWNPDPFAAKKQVEERQAKRKEKLEKIDKDETVQGRKEAGNGMAQASGGERGWKNVPEVKMTQTQREVVEEIIRRMMSKYPSAILEATRESEATPSTLPSGANTPGFDPAAIRTQLIDLGFRRAHVDSCMAALVSAHERLHSGDKGRDPLMLSLSFLSPFEAAIEWLLVHLPEDDLPARYTPQRGVKDFVSSAAAGSGGQQGLLRGWLVDKVVKAGFPRKAVERVVDDAQSESMALDMIGRRLCGWDDEWGPQAVVAAEPEEERETVRLEEKTILSSVLGDRYRETSETEFQIDIDELVLNVIFSPESPYPSAMYPTHPPSFYLTSASLPSYIKLHLHAQVLRAFRDPERPDLRSLLEAGQGGAVYAMLEILEQLLPEAVENPPDVGHVTQFLVPQVETATEEAEMVTSKKRGQRRKREPMALQGVEERQKRMRQMPGWDKMLCARMALPAWQERDRITALLEKNRVLIVVGETGCGKSTQLPQFILDHEIEAGRGAQTRIVVTQPRRVSALGLASRVADERMEDLDQGAQTVGYAIRGESKTGPNTQISFVTTGVILRRLSAGGDADLEGVSHIVVDEVHERSVDSDFLLLQLRELLERNQRIKVVLMSATINQQTFINYFGGAPALEIPGFTHPVQDFYMEDYISDLSFRPEAPKYKMRQTEEQKQSLRDALAKLDINDDARRALEILSTGQSIPYDLVAAIVRHVDKTSKKDEGILIFMPGVAEIKSTIDVLRSAGLRDCTILPLHANLSNNEQKQVFAKTSGRKVVVATNVAETSITIPEIVYVIDCGKVKETQYDPDTSMSKLVETYTSRAASKQRRGRAGRVKPGVCYKLFTRRIEEQYMARFAIPEILRTPLESLFLQVKSMDQSIDVKTYLLKAIDPPKIGAIDSAWRTLLDLGAVEGEAMTSHLTALGRHMAALPVDLRLAKMLVLGCVFRALDPVLTIAAMLSSKPLFAGPMEKREEMKRARERFAWGKSDILLNLRAYDATRDLRNASLRAFCEENFINPSTIRDINSLRQDFLGSLTELGYITDRTALNVNSDNEHLLKGILTGAFYPRVAMIRPPDARFEKIQAGALVKEHEAKEVKFYDDSSRVFIHPAAILFSEPNLKLGYLTYFHKAETSKPFLFDATEIPLFALLLFGGSVTVNHFAGGLMVGKQGSVLRMRAWARVGVLVNQVRRLVDVKLGEAIEGVEHGRGVDVGTDVVKAVLTLLS